MASVSDEAPAECGSANRHVELRGTRTPAFGCWLNWPRRGWPGMASRSQGPAKTLAWLSGHHDSGGYVCPSTFKPVKIQPAGQPPSVERSFVDTGIHDSIEQRCDQAPLHVIHR